MKIQILPILLLSVWAPHCDMGQYQLPGPPRDLLQRPWVVGRITSGSCYPSYPLSSAEVVVSWGSGSVSSSTDSSGRFGFQLLPRTRVAFRATATDCDTVTLPIDLSSTDTATVEIALKMRKGFVPGQIILGFHDTTSLRSCVRFGASKGLSISRASGFRFLTDSVSADSAQNIKSVLSGKPYVGGGPPLITNGRVVVLFFTELNSDLLQDWETTSRQLGFREESSGGPRFVLSVVSAGTEHDWIRTLSVEPLLRYICLNGIYTI
jgi:hypothetical protein